MDSAEDGSYPGEWKLETGINEYVDSVEAGNYRRTVDSVLSNWSTWLQENRDAEVVDEISVLDCRRYARHLKKQSREDELKASTANTYYSVVRAFLSFCVAEEAIDSNPAEVKRAVDELPSDNGDTNRQFWGRDERRQFLDYVDERARDSLDEDSSIDREEAFRDRALVYVLALSGVRSAEIFKDPADEMRNGATWNDLDLENGTLRVFGKSREYEHAQVPDKAVQVLKRYRKVLNPETSDWPLFPSNHAPSKYKALEKQAGSVEYEDIDRALREHSVVPPALSKNGARSIVERLCGEAGVDVDGEPLKLHGARRGLGHELYRKGHAELAQSALRHSSIDVTHEAYSDIQASETADRVGDVLDS